MLATAALAGGLSLGTALLPSVLGAVAGGIAAWIAAQRLLGLRRAPFATLALGLTAVVAVGRWGCLLNGCCFGQRTELPWAVHYGSGSAPWLLHHALGWIGAEVPVALGVHPYPLYDSAGLFVWLPLAFWLARRLRCEAALLLFTAAYDLALRALIDGTRAMVNVWWTLLGSPGGIGLFQWALLGAALACLGGGLVVERRARAQAAPEPDRAVEPRAETSWAIFLGLWLVGWISSTEQTLFLHWVLVGALLSSALALRLPAWRLPRRGFAWAAPSLAVALAVPVVLHVEHAAEADERPPGASARQGWVYDIDHRRGVMVRVGTQQESPESMAQRRVVLDLPDTALPTPLPAAAGAQAGRTWVAGGGLGGNAHYRVGDSCSGNYTLYDRSAGGGFVQVERELPATPTSVWWLGGRGSALFESQSKTIHNGDTSTDSVAQYAMQTYAAQLWGEWEHPNISVGIGGLAGARNRHAEGAGSQLVPVVRPSFRLRAGASFLGIDGGYCDRYSFVGSTAAHIGLSGAIGPGRRIAHPDETVVRYFVGGVTFPGADDAQNHFMLGVGLEIFASPRLVLGLQGAGGDGIFGLGYVRVALAPAPIASAALQRR